jgi:acetyl-CoA acetyltransferase
LAPISLAGQFEQSVSAAGAVPVLRYVKTYGLAHQQLAMVSVAQREWAVRNPHATFNGADHRRGCAELANDRLPVPMLQCCR